MKFKIKQREMIGLGILLGLICVLLLVYQGSRRAPVEGQKSVAIEVIHGDGSSQHFQYDTVELYLGDLLLNEGVAEGAESPYGLYLVAVDGEQAREELQEWWCITKAGEMVLSGSSTIILEDGDSFELTLMKGY